MCWACRPRARLGVECLCWACLKTGGGKANPYFSGDRQKPWAIGNGPSPPLYAQMNCAYPFFEATSPGAAPGPRAKTGARVRRFQGCNELLQHTDSAL